MCLTLVHNPVSCSVVASSLERRRRRRRLGGSSATHCSDKKHSRSQHDNEKGKPPLEVDTCAVAFAFAFSALLLRSLLSRLEKRAPTQILNGVINAPARIPSRQTMELISQRAYRSPVLRAEPSRAKCQAQARRFLTITTNTIQIPSSIDPDKLAPICLLNTHSRPSFSPSPKNLRQSPKNTCDNGDSK